jgi:hypothetical protein
MHISMDRANPTLSTFSTEPRIWSSAEGSPTEQQQPETPSFLFEPESICQSKTVTGSSQDWQKTSQWHVMSKSTGIDLRSIKSPTRSQTSCSRGARETIPSKAFDSFNQKSNMGSVCEGTGWWWEVCHYA